MSTEIQQCGKELKTQFQIIIKSSGSVLCGVSDDSVCPDRAQDMFSAGLKLSRPRIRKNN